MNPSSNIPFETTDDHPWPGMAPYGEGDATRFFGRTQETDTLLRMVMRETLTVVFGPSGVGKTSLLNAGLFPILREEQLLPVRIRLEYGNAEDPTQQVKDAIADAAKNQSVTAEPVAPALSSDAETLWEYLHRMEFWDQQNKLVQPVLVFDQFEELFTLGWDHTSTGSFMSELADVVENNLPAAVKTHLSEKGTKLSYAWTRQDYKVVFSLREDFVSQLDRLRPVMPLIMHNRLPVAAMNGIQALEAVLGPGGHLLDETVARQMVRFVAAEESTEKTRPLQDLSVEPVILSVFCRELNQARMDNGQERITPDLVNRRRESILADFYDRSVKDLAPATRIFIEEELLTASGFRDSMAVEDAKDRYGISQEDLSLLETRRLVRREERQKTQRIELVHDRLTSVIKERRDARRLEEKRQEEEQERQELRNRTRKLRRRSIAFLALAFLAIAGSLLAGLKWFEAEKKEAEAARSKSIAKSEAERAKKTLSDSYFLQGIEKVANGNAAEGLAYLASAIRTHPKQQHSAAAARIVQLFLQREFILPAQEPIDFGDWRHLNLAAFSPDGLKLVTYTPTYTEARIWDVFTGKPISEPMKHNSSMNYACFSPDGSKILTLTDSKLKIWSSSTAKPLSEIQTGGDSACFSPDGSKILTVSNGNVFLWDVASGKLLLEKAIGPHRYGPVRTASGFIISASFSSDGSKIVTASGDKSVRFWDVSTGRFLFSPLWHNETVYSAVFNASGSRMLTVCGDGIARVWSLTGEGPIEEAKLKHGGKITSANFSPDGSKIVTASNDRSARVWDSSTGEPLSEPMWHNSTVYSANFSLDGSKILTISADQTAHIWDASTHIAKKSGFKIMKKLVYCNQVLSIQS